MWNVCLLVTKSRCSKCGVGGRCWWWYEEKSDFLRLCRGKRMAQHQNRSNHVRVDNLPPNMTDCRELLSQMELAGNVQVKIWSGSNEAHEDWHREEVQMQLVFQKLFSWTGPAEPWECPSWNQAFWLWTLWDGKNFRQKLGLKRHRQKKHNLTSDSKPEEFVCKECGASFFRRGNLKNRVRKFHNLNNLPTIFHCGRSGVRVHEICNKII